MKIQENQQQDQELAVQFKTLALDLFKMLSLPEIDRGIEGLKYFNKVYEKYITLVENSAILTRHKPKIIDKWWFVYKF